MSHWEPLLLCVPAAVRLLLLGLFERGRKAGKEKRELNETQHGGQRTHGGYELVHAVGGHAVEVREVELQVDLVVEHVLAQRASEHRLDRVLRHHVHSESVQVCVGELAVGALVHLDHGGDGREGGAGGKEGGRKGG